MQTDSSSNGQRNSDQVTWQQKQQTRANASQSNGTSGNGNARSSQPTTNDASNTRKAKKARDHPCPNCPRRFTCDDAVDQHVRAVHASNDDAAPNTSNGSASNNANGQQPNRNGARADNGKPTRKQARHSSNDNAPTQVSVFVSIRFDFRVSLLLCALKYLFC